MSADVIPILILLIAFLSAAVGALAVLAITQRAHVKGLEGDILTLWSEVFGGEEAEPDPADEEEPPSAANVIELKGRAA